MDSGHYLLEFLTAGEMKSLKHYFLSPVNKELKETSKEPLQSSQSVNEISAAKQEEKETVVTSVKEKKKKESKSKKLVSDTPCEPVNGKTHEEEKGLILQSEIEVTVDEKEKIPRADSPVLTPKSNAFQLLMSQKKNVTPEKEPEKKKKSLSHKDSKTLDNYGSETVQPSKSKKKSLSLSNAKSKKLPEVPAPADDINETAGNKTDKELSNGPAEEPARPQRATRQAKEKAKKSFEMLDELLAEEEYSTPKSKRQSRKKEEPEQHRKKTAEKPTQPFQEEKVKKRKKVISSDDEQKCSPTKVQTTRARIDKEKQSPTKYTKKADESQVRMEIDEPEPSKDLPKEKSTQEREKKPAELNEVDSEDDFVLFKKSKKRKMSQKEKTTTSPEKITPNVNKKSIAGYFTSISKDEAIKRAAVSLESAKTQTIKADIHVEPAGNQRKRSMGPSGRLSSSKSPNGADTIEVLESITLETKNEDVVVKEKSPIKTPVNKLMHRKKRLWEMKVKLLSPAKTVSEASSIASDSDSIYSGNFCFL